MRDAIRRRHLIEIAEQPWCPAVIREGVTDYLAFIIDRGRPYEPAVPLLAAAIRRTTAAVPVPIVDLASGGGGPWRALAPALAEVGVPVAVCLTDRFPNRPAYERLSAESASTIRGDVRSVSADAVPDDLPGFRTIFSAFHHFPPAVARRVLAGACARREGIAVFEATRRDLRAILLVCLTPAFVLFVTPFVRPFSWSRLLFTYLLPVIPLTVLVDGVVSCLRTYTPAELRTLAAESGGTGYTWEAGECGSGPIPVTYLVGTPADGQGLSISI